MDPSEGLERNRLQRSLALVGLAGGVCMAGVHFAAEQLAPSWSGLPAAANLLVVAALVHWGSRRIERYRVRVGAASRGAPSAGVLLVLLGGAAVVILAQEPLEAHVPWWLYFPAAWALTVLLLWLVGRAIAARRSLRA